MKSFKPAGYGASSGRCPLAKTVEEAKTASIIVDDWARPVVTRLTVAPIVLNPLAEHGISFQRERHNILAVVDGISKSACADIGIGCAANVQDAFDAALLRHGSEAKVAVIAGLGNISLPVIAGRQQG